MGMGNYGRDSGDNRGGGGRSFGGRNNSGGRDFGRDNRGGGRGDRQMHSATCDNCGKDCEVPFRPTSGKPVYCSDCFEKMGGRQDSPRSQRSQFRSAPGTNQNNAQLEAISFKLDEIIKLLKPQTVKKVEAKKTRPVKKVVEEVEKIEEKAKPSKAKKSPAKKK